jgi:hypothetical protein
MMTRAPSLTFSSPLAVGNDPSQVYRRAYFQDGIKCLNYTLDNNARTILILRQLVSTGIKGCYSTWYRLTTGLTSFMKDW